MCSSGGYYPSPLGHKSDPCMLIKSVDILINFIFSNHHFSSLHSTQRAAFAHGPCNESPLRVGKRAKTEEAVSHSPRESFGAGCASQQLGQIDVADESHQWLTSLSWSRISCALRNNPSLTRCCFASSYRLRTFSRITAGSLKIDRRVISLFHCLGFSVSKAAQKAQSSCS